MRSIEEKKIKGKGDRDACAIAAVKPNGTGRADEAAARVQIFGQPPTVVSPRLKNDLEYRSRSRKRTTGDVTIDTRSEGFCEVIEEAEYFWRKSQGPWPRAILVADFQRNLHLSRRYIFKGAHF